MKFLIFLGLVALAMGSEECTEERATGCLDGLLTAVVNDASENELCRELRSSVDCLRDTVDECLGDEKDDEVEEGLQDLENIYKENCGGDLGDEDEDDRIPKEVQKCFEDNQDYIYECIEEGSTAALELAMDQDNMDENFLQCLIYSMISECFVDRMREKCGEEAAEVAEKELNDAPKEIEEACEAAGSLIAHEFELLEDRKKK
nr:venom protein [Lampona murina]